MKAGVAKRAGASMPRDTTGGEVMAVAVVTRLESLAGRCGVRPAVSGALRRQRRTSSVLGRWPVALS